MNQFSRQIPERSIKEQLQSILRTHEDNLRDVKIAMRPQGLASTYMVTLQSDIEIMKRLIEKL